MSDLAAGGTISTPDMPVQLWAGEAPIITGQSTAVRAVTQYQVVVLTDAGVNAADATANDGAKCVIAAQPAAIGQAVPYFSGGFFNHAVLGWPSAIDTLAKRKAMFAGTTIKIGSVLN
jgi:hypothetical protein